MNHLPTSLHQVGVSTYVQVEKWRQVGSLASIQRHLVSYWQVGEGTNESSFLLGISFERKASAPPSINSGFNENGKKSDLELKKIHQEEISKMCMG